MTLPFSWSPLLQSWRKRALETKESVLLESALPSTRHISSLLFTQPVCHLILLPGESVDSFLQKADQALALGFHLAGYISYEFGSVLLGLPYRTPNMPLARLGVYASPEIFCHTKVAAVQDAPTPAELDLTLFPEDAWSEYLRRFDVVQNYIAAGDTYQVNLTTRLRSSTSCTTEAIYTSLLAKQPSGYAAAITLDDRTILSCSPELFFSTTADGEITTQPMKGTAPRAVGARKDTEVAAALQADEKNRAEHVMIVDLLRNDLGRICTAGTITVDDLFSVQMLSTVHQMVSTVRGRLRSDIRWTDILRALFPSGSITGAPKHRTMEIIHELEPRARGVYTGAIGYVAPDGSSSFSVAIRTLSMQRTGSSAKAQVTLGVGGGIVSDSVADAEWKECLLKARFVRQASAPVYLLETMRCDAGHIPLLNLHLQRLASSAGEIGYRLDEHDLRHLVLSTAQAHADGLYKLRLELAEGGQVRTTCSRMEPWPQRLHVALSRTAVEAADPLLRHKTSARGVYDTELAHVQAQGMDEALFYNERGELTEGCISTLFVLRNGRLLTPRQDAGVLPGVLRSVLVARGVAVEDTLTVDGLRATDAVFLGNSVRGLRSVASLLLRDGTLLWFVANDECAMCDRVAQLMMDAGR